jgi:hypothetical protein
MALHLPIETMDGEAISAYLVPVELTIIPRQKRSRFSFQAYRSAMAAAEGKAPLQFPMIPVDVVGDDFDATAAAPLSSLWADVGGVIPPDATIYDALARLAYGLGKQHSEVLATAEDV